MSGDRVESTPPAEPDPGHVEPELVEPDGEVVAEDEVDVEVVVDVEILDGPLVLAGPRPPVVRVAPRGVAVVQTAAVAATGFVAGVATAAVLGRRRQRRLAAPAGPPAGTTGRVVSHRTYLVDVRLLERH